MLEKGTIFINRNYNVFMSAESQGIKNLNVENVQKRIHGAIFR